MTVTRNESRNAFRMSSRCVRVARSSLTCTRMPRRTPLPTTPLKAFIASVDQNQAGPYRASELVGIGTR